MRDRAFARARENRPPSKTANEQEDGDENAGENAPPQQVAPGALAAREKARWVARPANSVVAHVAWTVGERFAVTGDSRQPCLCVWRRNEVTFEQQGAQ